MSIKRDFSLATDMKTVETNKNEYKMDGQNPAANKNYMSSLAAEGVRSGVLASAVYRQTVCRFEIQPCI